MSENLTMSMVNNATLLLSLSVIYEVSYLLQKRLKKLSKPLSGLIIGLICIVIMAFPFQMQPGLIFDTRTILISVAALTFGAVPAGIAAAMAFLYRLSLGGVGMMPGLATIATALFIGLLARRAGFNKKLKLRWLKIYAMGLAVHVVMLACMLLMPAAAALETLRRIALPVMIIYPLGVVLLSLLLIRQTERSQALMAAAEADARYRSIFHNSHASMLIIDPEDGRIVDVNPAAAAFYGWPAEEIRGMHISRINTLPAEDIKKEMDRAISGVKNHFFFKHNRAAGGPVDVEVHAGSVEFGGKRYLYSIVHDISEQVAYQKALKESEERFRLLVDNAPDAIFVMVGKGNFAFINNAGLALLGAKSQDELLGKSGLTVIHPDQHEDIYAYMKRMREEKINPGPVERTYIRLDGSHVFVDTMVVPIVYNGEDARLIIARDITERKHMQQKEQAMEAQLRQQQKLEAIGTLAGGVAHEINNPLNGIMNYAQLIYDACDPDTSSAEYASEIIHETERISVIVKNLLQFSRQEKQSHSYASIYDIINQTISLVNTVIRKDQIQLDIRLDEGLPDIKCRSQQIQQVIMNLLTNARDALNEKYPGYDENKIIRVRCSAYESGGRRWLRLTVLDYGAGIPPELGDRIFEPFFSTKPKEIGTGLGLSISYGIVKEHHGTITFEAERGKYTKFILDLPVDNGWTL
jgi:PAS domain S-box-containing protein